MIEELIALFAALIQEMVLSAGNKAAQEAALMAAEEKIASLRARTKFGAS